MLASDLDYELPDELIAQEPAAERESARMMVVDRAAGTVAHAGVRELAARIGAPALLVVNDTRVIPARLAMKKEGTGGKVELLLVTREGPAGATERWTALARASKGMRAGMELGTEEGWLAGTVRSCAGDGSVVVDLRVAGMTVSDAVERWGQIPLPPYIRRAADGRDRERYQTVFADKPGAVAAPTAGLHLGEGLLRSIADAGHRLAKVTLHVGPGTFAPLRSERLEEHVMHAERYEVPEVTAAAIDEARREGRRVVAVGTTVVRTLESAAIGERRVRAGSGATSIFVYPPYEMKVVDALLTNFHLPRSTLLALVMAFGGVDLVRRVYAEAVRERYRFFSYGDAMLLL